MRILDTMSTPVPTRFSKEDLAQLDDLVKRGVGDSRSAVIRHAVQQLAQACEGGRTDVVRKIGDSETRRTADDIGTTTAAPVTADDLKRLAVLAADLDDPAVMSGAWS